MVPVESVYVDVVMRDGSIHYISGEELDRDMIDAKEWAHTPARSAECVWCDREVDFPWNDPQWVTYAKEHNL